VNYLIADIDEAEKQSLLESIDYERLSEVALQQAHDSQLVPDRIIAKAALALCTKLRSELDGYNSSPSHPSSSTEGKGRGLPTPPSTSSSWPKSENQAPEVIESDSSSDTRGARGERPPTDVGRGMCFTVQ